MFRKQDTKIHFVGIGGMGMCGIAEVLANMGYRVSGSDMNDTEITRHLASIGCTVKQGHRADNLGEADVVVVSSAIKGYNPEVEAARARQIPVIPRAEMLGELMRMKYGIAIAGAHGKTTSTTMMHTVLMAAGSRSDRRDRRPRELARPGERALGQERLPGRRGRRERRLVPDAVADASRSSRTSTPSTSITTARSTTSRRRSSTSATACRSSG